MLKSAEQQQNIFDDMNEQILSLQTENGDLCRRLETLQIEKVTLRDS